MGFASAGSSHSIGMFPIARLWLRTACAGLLAVSLLAACAARETDQAEPGLAAPERSETVERARQTALMARQLDQPLMFETALEHWIELAPKDEQAWSLLIQHALESADADLLKQSMMTWLSLRASSSDRWEDLAISVREHWRDDLLRRTFVEVLRETPDADSVADNLYRSELAEAMGSMDQANRSAQRAIDQVDQDDEAARAQKVRAYRWHARLMHAQGRALAEIDSLSRALELDESVVEVRLQMARRLAEAGFVEQSIELLRQSRDADSRIGLMLGMIGAEHSLPAVLDEGISLLQHQGDEGDGRHRLNLAQLLVLRGDRQQAVELLASLAGSELEKEADFERARLLASLGRREQAQSLLRGLWQAEDDALAERVWLLSGQLASEQSARQAFEVLSRGLVAVPDAPSLLYARALEAEKLGFIATAERDLRRLIDIEPENAHAFNALGYMLTLHTDRLDEAEVLITRALELEPEHPAIIDSMGWLRFHQGQFDRAVEYLRRAHAKGFNAEIAAHLVQALSAVGEADEASALLDESLRQAPDNRHLRRLQDGAE